MKTRLLKKLRRVGRKQISIHSITTGSSVGMSYGYSDDAYSDLYVLGDTEKSIKNRAMRIYLKSNIEQIRKKYAKYRRVAA